MKRKILITSAGSGVAQNVMETLQNRRENLYIVGLDADTMTPVYNCDKVYLTPYTELPPSEYYDFFRKIIIEESPDLVIPGRDVDVIILGQLQKEFPERAHTFIAGPPELSQLMEDKWLSYCFARENSLPFADSIEYQLKDHAEKVEKFIETHGFPLIVKPKKGFASKGVSLVLNAEQLNLKNAGEMIIQEYLGDGDKLYEFYDRINRKGLPLFYSLEEVKYSLQCFIDQDGTVKGRFITAHRMVNGVSAGVTRVKDPKLSAILDQYCDVFSKKGWFGPLNIQVQQSHKNNEFKAYELNARYTGATGARYLLGYDEVGFGMEVAFGSKAPKDGLYNSQESVNKQTFVSQIPRDNSKSLKEKGVWERGKEL
jgi:carbamoyl-phosphate synthase large subunit